MIQSVCELLWPDETPELARNAFRVNLTRLRKALDEATIVSREEQLLNLAPATLVDLWEIEDVLAAVRCSSIPAERTSRLEVLHQRLHDWQPELAPSWEWFAPTVRRIAEIDHEVSERLARLYLMSGKLSEALALADRMIERDPLDEPAHELRLRILMAQGEGASAARELRLYGTELRRELGIDPPASLTSLVR
jgi:DNA-binding SARP family transcriptional activator